MEVFVLLFGMLAVLLAGIGLRSRGVLDARRTDRVNAAAYYVALPALIFVSTYDQAIGELLSPALFGGLLFVLGVTVALSWLIHHRRNPSAGADVRSVAIVQSYHSNLGYLGLPLVAATLDAEATAIASVILGTLSLVQVPLTVTVLATLNGAETQLAARLRGLLKNPVIAALLAGLVAGPIGVEFPGTAVTVLDAVGSLALPLALLCVGASLKLDLPSVDVEAAGTVLALKLAWMPALAWFVFTVLTVNTSTLAAAVVMLGTPTAVSTYVFTSELGGDEAFASLNVFTTTVASIGTLLVLVTILG
ncbi:AEC family transporter [Halobacteria archaeon AArc-dxtr1]|nr:AEC family transporter [Halobacteria archaeon AArc-dxtr1]